MPGNYIKSQKVNLVPVINVINLARNANDQDRAKHMIFCMLRFYTRLVENSEAEQQLLRDFIVEKGW